GHYHRRVLSNFTKTNPKFWRDWGRYRCDFGVRCQRSWRASNRENMRRSFKNGGLWTQCQQMPELACSDWPITEEFYVSSLKEQLFRNRPLQANNRVVGRRYGGGIEAGPGVVVLLAARI